MPENVHKLTYDGPVNQLIVPPPGEAPTPLWFSSLPGTSIEFTGDGLVVWSEGDDAHSRAPVLHISNEMLEWGVAYHQMCAAGPAALASVEENNA